MFDDTLLRQNLIDYLNSDLTLVDHWLEAAVVDWNATAPARQSYYILQAKRLLALVVEGLCCYSAHTPPLSPERETTLRHDFPLIYSDVMLQSFAALTADYFHKRYPAIDITDDQLLTVLRQGFASCTIASRARASFAERLERLNSLSLHLCELREQDAILDYALTEAPRLVGAESCMLWPWDADQQAPTMMVAPQLRILSFPFSEALLALFRRTCTDGCALAVNYDKYTTPWPPELLPFAVVFVPLLTPQGCLGILAVQHYPDEQFTQEDILLLSALGNLVATALVNAQLYATDRHPVNLLQTSIRQVVLATSNSLDQYEEFLQSLLQVGEGLTRAEAVCAFVKLEERQAPITGVSGTLPASLQMRTPGTGA